MSGWSIEKRVRWVRGAEAEAAQDLGRLRESWEGMSLFGLPYFASFFFQLRPDLPLVFLISSLYLHVVVTAVLQSTPLSLPPLSAPLPVLSPGYLSHSYP